MSLHDVNLAVAGSGSYRVRCSAKGRAASLITQEPDSGERFHFDVWKAPQT